MKLIVFYPIICTDDISYAPIKFRIPPLSLMKGRTNIKRIVHTGWGFNIPAKFYELFSPIQEDSYSGHIETVFPIYGSFYKHRQAYTQIHQGKEMPPNKIQYFFGFTPDWLYRFHRFFPHIHSQDITTLIKYVPLIISMNRTLSFHEWLAFEGGQIHEL